MLNKRLIYLIGIISLIFFAGFVAGAAVDVGQGQALSALQARELISMHQDDNNFVILDVRTPAEFASGHIAGAMLLDYYGKGFTESFAKLDKTKTYLIYCRSGNRSDKTLDLASKYGFTKMYHIGRGVRDWLSNGYPLVK